MFDDLYDFYLTEADDNYFLGSIVLVKEETHPHADVIDGQQRLTTLTILLAALPRAISGKEPDQLDTYIRQPPNEYEGLEAKPRLRLRSRDQEFFQHHIQELNFPELATLDPVSPANEARKNIQRNAAILTQRLEERFQGDKGAP